MSLGKKLISGALAATTGVWLSGAMLLVPVAHAQLSAAQIQEQINALLATIQQLQAQLAGVPGGGVVVACTFTRDLTVGVEGNDVKCLQQYLNGAGFTVATSGAGSPGSESTYFGSRTLAAVKAWQGANGVTPVAGYFGPKSQAKYTQLAAGGVVTPPGGTIPPGTVPATGLSVTAGPAVGLSAVSGAGQVDVGKFNVGAAVTAGATITGFTFKKVGVVSDTHISNLYVADETGTVIAQYTSLNQGVAVFSGLNIQVNAGQIRTLTLRMDLSNSATAGNTIAWAVETVTAGTATVVGVPLTMPTLTVTTVSNPSLSTATWNFNAVGSTVDAGTNNVLVGTASVGVSNSAVWLKSVKFTIVGSANMGDLRNLKLQINGTQVGNTIAQVPTGGELVFDLSANPVKISTGNAVADVYADIAGSPNRNFTVRVLRPYDLHLVDSQYNVGISPTVTDDSTQITINQGQITVSLASDTPTGNIPNGASNVTIAKFTIYAAGENVKVRFLDFTVTQGATGDTWATLANVTEDIQNLQLVDDAGNQVGSTISTIASGTGNGQCTLTSATVITCHLGTSSSYINYIVPANTTRVLSLKVDVLSTNDAPSLQGALAAGSTNLEGQTSFQTASSGAATGATLTVTSNPLSLTLNGAFAAPTYVAGANKVRLASFVAAAAAAEGAKVTSITVDKDSNANLDLQNLQVFYGGNGCTGTQFGTTRPTIGDAETSLTFSGSPIIVNSGASVVVDFCADILSSSATGTQSAVIDYTSLAAVGLISNSALTAPSAVSGQNVVISTGPTLTLAVDTANPAASQVPMGLATTPKEVFAVRLSNDNIEDVKLTDLVVRQTIGGTTVAGRTTFYGMELWDGTTKIAGPVSPVLADTTTSTITFGFGATPVVIGKNTSKTLKLTGRTTSFDNGGVSGSTHTFSVAAITDVTARGKDSQTAATISGTPGGNAHTVYRSKLSLAASLIAPSSGRTRSAVDDLANISFTADSAGQLTLGTVAIKFTGLAVTNGTAAFTVDLLKSDGTALGSATQQTCTPGLGNSCSVTFGPALAISAGAPQAAKIRISSASFTNAANSADALSITINSSTDVLWVDGLIGGASTTNAIGLETSLTPFVIANTSYE